MLRLLLSLLLLAACARALRVGPCGGEQDAAFGLVEVETGASPVLSTSVHVCQTERGLRVNFDATELKTHPPYQTRGCNDMVVPPYKSNAVEIFIG